MLLLAPDPAYLEFSALPGSSKKVTRFTPTMRSIQSGFQYRAPGVEKGVLPGYILRFLDTCGLTHLEALQGLLRLRLELHASGTELPALQRA